MSKTKKPRKAYRARPVYNPLTVAIPRVALLTPAQRTSLIAPALEALARLKDGSFSVYDFNELCSMNNIAYALTLPGIGLLPDHEEKWDASRECLAALVERRNATSKWLAKGDELAAIELAIEFYGIQLDYASLHDMQKAQTEVNNKIAGGRSAKGAELERYKRFDIVEAAL